MSMHSVLAHVRRRPGLTLFAVAVLAAGMLPLTAMWQVLARIHAWNRSAASVPGLVWVESLARGASPGVTPGMIPAGEVLDGLRSLKVFQGVWPGRLEMLEVAGGTPVRSLRVDPGLLQGLQFEASRGRLLTSLDALPGTEEPVLVTEAGARRLAADRHEVLDTRLDLGGARLRVVGVLSMPLPESQWAEVHVIRPLQGLGAGESVQLLAQLASGMTSRQAEAALSGFEPLLDGTGPSRHLALRPAVSSGDPRLVWGGFLLGLPTFIVACAVISALLVSLMAEWQRSLAMKAAMGAGRRYLLLEVMAFPVIICIVGTGVAMLVSHLLLETLTARGLLPELPAGGWDVFLALRLSGVALFGMLICAWLPLRRVMGLNPAALIGGGASTPADSRRGWPRRLAAIQLGVALAMVGGSVPLLRHALAGMATVPFPHWQRAAVMELGGEGRALSELRPKLGGLPGIRTWALGTGDPLPGGRGPLQLRSDGGESVSAIPGAWEPGVLAVMGLRQLAGRHPEAVDEVLVSQALGQRLWPGVSPLGRRVWEQRSARSFEVVGICESPGDPQHPGQGSLWMVTAPERATSALMALDRNDAATLQELRQALAARLGDADLRVTGMVARRAQVTEMVSATAVGLLGLGGLGLGLAVAGTAATAQLLVARRRREMAIRCALGATPQALIRQVLRETLTLVAWGLPLGLGGALGVGWLLNRVIPACPVMYLPSLAALLVLLPMTSALASLIPALKVSRVSACEVLRHT